ncbi:hypothetical protein QCA50_005140 [Cerrena zonata]|uniref:MIF4G domain-containing protein n=1 Tax=Cerrena zonata TaxID=2478898 RepID=A0AAW0GEN0_9APHY
MSSQSRSSGAQQPWRPWRVPLDTVRMHRKLCGILNRLTPSNFEAQSNRLVQLAILVEKTEDSDLLDAFVRKIFRCGLSQPSLTDVYVELCQKVVDELEGERSRWRKVDVFHIGNPMVSFDTSLKLLVQYEFDRIVDSGDFRSLKTYATLVGGLLVGGVLLPNDVQGILDDLFQRTLVNDDHTVAICRFLGPVLDAFSASQFLDLLGVFGHVEHILRQEKVSPKTRYLMLNLHDEMVYPQPLDAFSSTRQRIEVYGLDDGSDVESLSEREDFAESTEETVEEAVEEEMSVDEERLRRTCRTEAREDILRRSSIRIQRFFEILKPHHRHIFVSSLLSTVFQFGDEDDATFIAAMFSSDMVRNLCYSCDAFVEGFKPEITVLEDTSIDVLEAYSMMALMLQATGLSTSTVTDIAAFVGSTDTYERFLEAYSRTSSS